MGSVSPALAFLVMVFAGWVNRQQLIAIEYLQAENRLLRERQLADRPVSSIAYEAGFGDLSYFNRFFRRFFGTTPRDIRASQARPG